MRRVESVDRDYGEKLPCSPLRPLKNNLCLLRALGLPLRMGGEDGSYLTDKMAFAVILLLPIALDLAFFGGKGWVLLQGLPDINQILDLFKRKGLKNWDIFSQFLLLPFNIIVTFLYMHFYNGMGPKLTRFISTYKRAFGNLDPG